MAKKLNVAVIFGGRSGEHEVSLVSAEAVMKNLDKSKYNIIPVGISKQGEWISGRDALKLLKNNNISKALKATLVPDTVSKSLVILARGKKKLGNGGRTMVKQIDVVFPVLHGTYGEDGCLQGLLELADIAYVGAGVLGSAVGMDKISQKILCGAENIRVPDWVWISKGEWQWTKKNKAVFKKWLVGVEERLDYPCFVKPSNLGSSVGISKVKNRSELIEGINLAARYDRRILIEKSIEAAMEIEVSVLGNEQPEASMPGQIVSSNEFYDYNAKYVDGQSKSIIPAPLPERVTREVRDMAIECYKLLDCAGMARVDFLVQKQGRKMVVYLSELNTIPGFTSISMYPKLWQASGVNYKKLLDILIRLAVERFNEKKTLRRSYQTKSWYR